jgi:hypothetical protein
MPPATPFTMARRVVPALNVFVTASNVWLSTCGSFQSNIPVSGAMSQIQNRSAIVDDPWLPPRPGSSVPHCLSCTRYSACLRDRVVKTDLVQKK